MESTQHSFRVAREKKRIEEQCLRRAILNLSRALKFERLGVWMRCNAAWRARVATMRCARLKREFEFLLARCPHKRIVRFYKKFGERDTVITRIIGEFIERAGLRDLNVFEELMERYSFILMSEQYSEFFSTSQSSFVYDESVFDAVAENANNESAQPVASTSGTVYTRRAATPLRTSSSDEDISTEDNLSLEAVLGDSQIPISESEEGHRPEDPGASPQEASADTLCAPSEPAPATVQPSEAQCAPSEPAPAPVQPSEAQCAPPAQVQGAVEPSEAEIAHPAAEENSSRLSPQRADSYLADDDESTSYSTSEDEASLEQRRIMSDIRNFAEPRGAVVRTVVDRMEIGDEASAEAIARFYSRSALPREREGHRVEEGRRLVYECFNETNPQDRRVNEGPIDEAGSSRARAETADEERETVAQVGAGRSSGQTPAAPGKRFAIEERVTRYLQRFKVTGERLSVRIKNPPAGVNPLAWLEAAIRDIYAYLLNLCNERANFIGVSVKSDSFAHGPGGLSLRPTVNFSLADFWGLIEGLTQSNDGFKSDENFVIEVTMVDVPRGKGRKKGEKYLCVDSVGQRSIVSIKNTDNLCLPRALVVGRAYLRFKRNATAEAREEWLAVRDGRRNRQRILAGKIIREARVTVPPDGCGLRELEKFQKYLSREGVAVVAHEKNYLGSGEPPFFDGRPNIAHVEGYQGAIHVLYDPKNRHYDTIINLVGACRSNFYCENCDKRYWRVDEHRCPSKCPSCFVSPPCATENVATIKCDLCNRNFFGEGCFANHNTRGSYKKNNRILCEILSICGKCGKAINRMRDKHVCGIKYCKLCKKKHPTNDLCFMQPIHARARKRCDNFLLVFYDFETRQDTSYREHETTRQHIPNLCVAQQACARCIEIDDTSLPCEICGIREHIFRENPVERLLEICTKPKVDFQQVICIAHNSKGFDAHFIVKVLIERTPVDSPPELILNGRNITMIRYAKTKFIDSLNYFQMRLSALPHAFGLPPSNKKGYFPHLFNTLKNQKYVGPLPDASFYAPDCMVESERKAFYTWYNETKPGYVFDFKKEIVEYCRMDVEILRRACIAFRKIFLSIGKTDPFLSACTIASACSVLYRRNFLTRDSIAIIPPNGYRRCNNHSQKAIEWLLYCERELECEIVHAGRSREFRLTEGFLVDGFLPAASTQQRGTVFEFQGCYYHGCPKCFAKNRDNRLTSGRSFDEAYAVTRAKIEKIKSLGYNVREMWECEFARLKEEYPEIDEYLATHPLMTRATLNPRDAFYGGRTENTVTYYKAGAGEKIKYTDICSLYPYVCKWGKYPIGHPRILVGSECSELTREGLNDISRVEGLVKCKILPPRDLFLPLLPVKMHGKLLFPLCRTCCEEMRQTDCDHEAIEERAFTGTWVSDELRKAVQLGYRVLEIYLIWQFDKTTQYNPRTREMGLFATYVNTFLKIKQEASGWPAHCDDDASKQRYVDEYHRMEGIRLESEKVEKNPGLRAVAKLCLNSFWGKFGQRDNLRQTTVIRSRQDLVKLLESAEKEVCGVLLVSDEVVFANWQYRAEAVQAPSNTNVVIAAYTTAHARIKLYEHLEKLGARALYFDTDSCIFVSRGPGEYIPPLGTLLGDMTDELKCYGDDAYIDTFVSGGPKFYGYRVVTPSTGKTVECCKVKGISLNFANSLKINFESIRELIERYFEDERDSIELQFRAIRRMPTHDIVTRDEVKSCSVVLKKRRYLNHALSLPFGYKSA